MSSSVSIDEAVARLDLDRRHAFRRAGRRRAAAPRQQFLGGERVVAATDETMPPPARAISSIARALEPHFEFAGAVAAVDDVGVAVDKTPG
jgi:hypothetical protein